VAVDDRVLSPTGCGQEGKQLPYNKVVFHDGPNSITKGFLTQ
jgi:hypothetical protein